MKPRILLFGPIGNIGGRELETGFIAKTLIEERCQVEILSTAKFSDKSQIFDFVQRHQIKNLNDTLFKMHFNLRALAWVSYIKSGKKKAIEDYVSNKISKLFFYKNYAKKAIESLVEDNDLIIICAQLSSAFIPEVVELAHSKGKPVVIRTSAKIRSTDYQFKEWLGKVSLFIHHSEANAARLSFLKKHSYEIIDQCTFKEEDMLKIPPVNRFKKLLFIGRLSPEKGIIELVRSFKVFGEKLYLSIIGDGPLYNEISSLINSENNIDLLGYKNQDEIINYIKESDAIIISSHNESGPLVGLEGLASARLIISTKVGAMPYRLKNGLNQFWFDVNSADSLRDVFVKIKNLTNEEIKTISKQNREIYLLNYKKNTLENLYKKSIFNLLKHKSTD